MAIRQARVIGAKKPLAHKNLDCFVQKRHTATGRPMSGSLIQVNKPGSWGQWNLHRNLRSMLRRIFGLRPGLQVTLMISDMFPDT